MSEKLVIISDLAGLEQLKTVISGADYIAYDTETTGVEKGSLVIGFSISTEIDTGYYVILHRWDTGIKLLEPLPTIGGAREILQCLVGKQLIMHNAGFDCAKTEENFGVELMPSVHTDTMELAHLLNENHSCGLKELGTTIFGDDARKEQSEMKASVVSNGGKLTKTCYELYKADSELIAKYGAKDTILTLKLFYHLIPQLFEEKLDKFFYEEESMPLLRGPTYQLNNTGLQVDEGKMETLRKTLVAECLEYQDFISREIKEYVIDKYPGTNKSNHFNANSNHHLAWLLFEKLGEGFHLLTEEGKLLCKSLSLPLPYENKDKRNFIDAVKSAVGQTWAPPKFNPKTGKMGRAKKVEDYWKYLSTGKVTMGLHAGKYPWIKALLEYKKSEKLLNTYVTGVQDKMKYGVIRPSFLQHGTTSGRYSSKAPNFQNLPREDKRVKSCIVPRPGMVFIGADYSQLEPRVFASVSQDESLMRCFESGEDFYSVIGAQIFGKSDCSMFKDDKNSFAVLYPKLRERAKVVALATPYGRTHFQQAATMGITREESFDLIATYFKKYPKVELMMLDSHEQAKKNGVVYNLFGRPRRIPEAKDIPSVYGKGTPHSELPYQARTLLNLGMNHRVQSTAASIMNRAAIAFYNRCVHLASIDPIWAHVKIALQIHDELIIESPETIAESVSMELKLAMENTVTLPGVLLRSDPKIGKSLADTK